MTVPVMRDPCCVTSQTGPEFLSRVRSRITHHESRASKIKNPRPNLERRATCEQGTKASGRVVNNDYANDLTGVGH